MRVMNSIKVIVNGNVHEIETVHYYKQSEAFYRALERGDAADAHMLFRSPTMMSPELVRMKIDHIMARERYKEAIRHAEETPNKFLELEYKLKKVL